MAIKRRLLTLLMTACLTIGLCAMPAMAFAATTTQDGLTVEVTADKTSYAAGDTVQVKTTVTNSNAAAVNNIKLEHNLPAGLKLATGDKTITIATLAAGASQTVTTTSIAKESTGEDTPVDDNDRPQAGDGTDDGDQPQANDNASDDDANDGDTDGSDLPKTADRPLAFALATLLLVLGGGFLVASRLHRKSNKPNAQLMGKTLSVVLSVVLVGSMALVASTSEQAYADPAPSQKTFSVKQSFTYDGVEKIHSVKVTYDEVASTPADPTPVDPTPIDPTPVDPTPVDPTPVDPTPVDPIPVAPTITSANSTTTEYGVSDSFQVTATGDATISYSLDGSEPTGVEIDSASGLITIADTTVAGTHNFAITAANGTSPDAVQSFTLIINKAPGALTISQASIAYGNSLSPQITAQTGGGTVSYQYKVQGADDATYSSTQPTVVGLYTVRGQATATTNYTAATSAPVDFAIIITDQTTPQFANHADIDKAYGNANFNLPNVTGGESSGAYSYRSSDDTVATVDTGGGVNIRGIGTTDIYVKKAGDSNYLDSAEDSITVNVAKGTGAAVSGAPTVSGTPTINSITVNAVTNAGSTGQAIQYAISTSSNSLPVGGWQSATTFGSLTPSTTYYVYARTAADDYYNAGAEAVSQAIDTASTYTFTAPLAITANGVTASVSFNKPSPQAAGTAVKATVTVLATATSLSGDFTIDLTSTAAGLASSSKTRMVPKGAEQNDTYDFDFTMPANNVSDFVLTFSFVENSHALTADTTPLGYWLSAFSRKTIPPVNDDSILGEVRLFANTFATHGYATCNGQLISIAQNTALFSRIETSFGGDGTTTFALPNTNGDSNGLLLPPLSAPVSSMELHYDIALQGVYPSSSDDLPAPISTNLALNFATGELEVMDEPLYYQPIGALGGERYMSEILLLNSSADLGSWLTECDGRALQISTNTALFALLGTTYGGNGQQTFALPNLTGKSPINGYKYYIVTAGIFPPRD
jgi:microcystin-dependent protein